MRPTLLVIGCLLTGCGDSAATDPPPSEPTTPPAAGAPRAESSTATNAAPTEHLPGADAAFIKAHLPGVLIGPSTTTPPLTLATEWLPLHEATSTFLNPGSNTTPHVHTMTATDRQPGLPVGSTGGGWAMNLPDKSVQYLRHDKGTGIVLPTLVSQKQALITRLNPPEPLVLSGIKPGEAQTSTVTVRIYDLHEPAVLAHSGSYTNTWEDLGGWTVKVPMGTFDTRLVHLHAKGTVGAASVDVHRYYFLAKGVGIVAYATESDITATIFYHDDTKRAGVLQSIAPAK